jgi:hypothetical protein
MAVRKVRAFANVGFQIIKLDAAVLKEQKQLVVPAANRGGRSPALRTVMRVVPEDFAPPDGGLAPEQGRETLPVDAGEFRRKSMLRIGTCERLPAFVTPGQRTMAGTRIPPS